MKLDQKVTGNIAEGGFHKSRCNVLPLYHHDSVNGYLNFMF